MIWVQRHAKAVIACVTAILASLSGIVGGPPAHWSALQWAIVASSVATAFTIWIVPELATGIAGTAKGIAAAVVSLAALVTPTLLADGISGSEWVGLAMAALSILGALFYPNAGYRYARKPQD